MLAAAEIAVVLQRAFVEFVSAIVELLAVVAELLHLISGEWLKVAHDREILIEDFHGIDAADGRSDGQAHGVAKRFGGCERAISDKLSGAAHALHSQDRDPATIGYGEDVAFKAAEARVQRIEGHLDNIEGVAAVEHLQIDCRMLVSVESDKADLSLLLCPGKGFENAIVRVDQFGVIVVDDLVNLPDIEMISLQAG